jgi:hypothetical protein
MYLNSGHLIIYKPPLIGLKQGVDDRRQRFEKYKINSLELYKIHYIKSYWCEYVCLLKQAFPE